MFCFAFYVDVFLCENKYLVFTFALLFVCSSIDNSCFDIFGTDRIPKRKSISLNVLILTRMNISVLILLVELDEMACMCIICSSCKIFGWVYIIFLLTSSYFYLVTTLSLLFIIKTLMYFIYFFIYMIYRILYDFMHKND